MEVLCSWAEQNDKGMDDALDTWSTVYTNISVITNRGTPLHRCHAPNTFGTVNMEHTIDLSLSWSE